MNMLELLKAARAKIEDPAHWTTGTFARNAIGNPVGWESDNACQFCALGALYSITRTTDVEDAGYTALLLASDCTPVHTNDSLGHEAVLEMYDQAIENASL